MKPRRVFATSFVVTLANLAAADPTPARHWKVTKAHDGCVATEVGKKPTPYACPEDETLPLKIVKPDNSTECFEDVGHRGNPPAPTRKLRCPK